MGGKGLMQKWVVATFFITLQLNCIYSVCVCVCVCVFVCVCVYACVSVRVRVGVGWGEAEVKFALLHFDSSVFSVNHARLSSMSL